MTKKHKNDENAVYIEPGSEHDPLAFIEHLYEKQIEWNDKHYKTTTEKLLDLLAECAQARAKLIVADTLRKKFFARFDNAGLKLRDGMSLTSKLVRYVFRITGNRASAYARVIDAANDAGISPAQLADWVTKQGGIEAVRRQSKDGISPAQRTRDAVERAENVLKRSVALATIDDLPKALQVDENNERDFTLALIRHDSSTGKGHIVCASGNAALIKSFLTSVAGKVAAANENATATVADTALLDARSEAIAAAVAAATAALEAKQPIAA